MGSGQRKSAESALNQQVGLASKQADVSEKVVNQALPWTTLAGKYYQDILKGGDALTKAVSPQIGSVAGQFGVARQRAKEQPLGGSRDRALRELDLGEASTKSNIYSGGINDAVSRLASMGESGTSTGLGGYGNASSNLANASASFSQMAQGKGSALGGLSGAGGGIAAAAIAA